MARMLKVLLHKAEEVAEVAVVVVADAEDMEVAVEATEVVADTEVAAMEVVDTKEAVDMEEVDTVEEEEVMVEVTEDMVKMVATVVVVVLVATEDMVEATSKDTNNQAIYLTNFSYSSSQSLKHNQLK